jgi:hypothetical protein
MRLLNAAKQIIRVNAQQWQPKKHNFAAFVSLIAIFLQASRATLALE